MMQLRRCLKTAAYTHVHVHGHRASVLTRLAILGLAKTASLLYTVHGYHPPHYPSKVKRFLANRLERALARRVDRFICVSESTQFELEQAVPAAARRCTVIPNGIPLLNLSQDERQAFRRRFREEYQIPSEAFVIGTVCRLQWQKSVHRLLQAFQLVAAHDPNIEMVLVGGGPERPKLEEMIVRLNLAKQCRLLGEVADTRPVYSMMDLFVLPSLWEGLPLTVLEAWDLHVPVVVTNVSGSRDLIEDGVTGFIAPNTATGLVQAIARARENVDQFPEMTNQARERLQQKYSLERMLSDTERVYRETQAAGE